MTSSEIKKLAIDYFEGRIFSSNDIPDNQEDMIHHVFLPLRLMDEDAFKKWQESKPAFVFEYRDKAGPRTINGLPQFTSMNTLTIDNLQEFQRQLMDLAKQRKEFEESENS